MPYAQSRINRKDRAYFILIISRNYILIKIYFCVVLFSTEQQLKYCAAIKAKFKTNIKRHKFQNRNFKI
jgi:hypothetical protein